MSQTSVRRRCVRGVGLVAPNLFGGLADQSRCTAGDHRPAPDLRRRGTKRCGRGKGGAHSTGAKRLAARQVRAPNPALWLRPSPAPAPVWTRCRGHDKRLGDCDDLANSGRGRSAPGDRTTVERDPIRSRTSSPRAGGHRREPVRVARHRRRDGMAVGSAWARSGTTCPQANRRRTSTSRSSRANGFIKTSTPGI